MHAKANAQFENAEAWAKAVLVKFRSLCASPVSLQCARWILKQKHETTLDELKTMKQNFCNLSQSVELEIAGRL